ncbi:hypothetical protein [Streptomyces palmae]|nr:hypothetical protein [Streptomyces palmae]
MEMPERRPAGMAGRSSGVVASPAQLLGVVVAEAWLPAVLGAVVVHA